MSKRALEVVLIYLITVIIGLQLYRAIQGSSIFKTQTEFQAVVGISLLIATALTILFVKLRQK